MKSKYFLIIILVTALLMLMAPGGIGQEAAQSSAASEPVPFLWKTQIDDNPVYLAGSVHGGRTEDYPLHSAYLDALDKATAVVFEVAEDKETLKKIMLSFIADYRVPKNQYLRTLLSEESRSIFTQLLGEEEAALYEQYQPWVGHMQVLSRMIIKAGFDPHKAVDFYLRTKAVEQGKAIFGLEDPLDQFKLFVMPIPIQDQLKVVEQIISVSALAALAQSRLFKTYYAGERSGFEKIFLSMYNFKNPTSLAGYQKMFANRNKKMVKKLVQTVKDNPGTYLVVVGSGHYFGPDSIRSLLEEQGYKIKDY